MKNKTKHRKRYTPKRADYRNGGRVQAFGGGGGFGNIGNFKLPTNFKMPSQEDIQKSVDNSVAKASNARTARGSTDSPTLTTKDTNTAQAKALNANNTTAEQVNVTPAPSPVAQKAPIEKDVDIITPEEQVETVPVADTPTPASSTKRPLPPKMKSGNSLLTNLRAKVENEIALKDYYQTNPDNPLAGQSDLGKRIAGGESIDSMNFYWVQPDGTVGSTSDGWSRVPKEFRDQVFLTQGEANSKSSDYSSWLKGDDMKDGDVGTGQPDQQEQFEEERGERIIRTGQTAEKIAAGEIPEGMVPKQELVKVAKGEEYLDEAVQMGELTPIEAEKVKNVTPEEVAQMEATQAEKPAVIEAAKMQAEKVTESPEVQAAKGEVRTESLAKAAQVDRVAPIEGADVEIPEGALAERVVGTISEGAKATAAINAGTSLARITRAKKQLTKAGLTDEQIEDIGNDPALLEDKLADFSEEERGLIEGLPEEALVSTQLNGLLEGMENGQIPPWAAPAVAQVEQMLAARGLSASSVGRDNLFNSIIQSAMPIAQSNAQAIQASVSQQKNIEAAANEANAQRQQQTATQNAQNVFNMDMAQFSADQQTSLSNSKFLQTVALTEANYDQQAAVQTAILMSQANLAEADLFQKAQIQNAQAFLQTDMANLNNQQQANVLKGQFEQQRLLSNQAAENSSRQFNSASENQTNQFMAGLNADINKFNAAQTNAASQFNTQQKNAAEARRVGIEADINKANAAIINQTKQFNQQLEFQRDQFNTRSEQIVKQGNVAWRRKGNLADTAAANAMNQQNVQMAFGLTSSAVSFLWQELRDQASFDFQFADNTATRKNNAMIAAASSEGDAAKNWSSNYNNVADTVDKIFGTK